MRSRMILAVAVLASALVATEAQAQWVRATVTMKPAKVEAGMQVPPLVEYYMNESQRMAAIVSSDANEKAIQFLAPEQGYMDTFSSKRNEILHSELTKLAILPQDNAFPTTLDKAFKSAYALLETDRPISAAGQQGRTEFHVLTTPAAEGVKVTLFADIATKTLLRVVQETPEGTMQVDYDYKPITLNSIYDFGIPKNSVKFVDNVPSGPTRAFLDQLDARVEKEVGDGVAVIITDPQGISPPPEAKPIGHDRNQPYTVEIFARSGAAFLYRVHALKDLPAGNLEQLLGALKNQPATSYVVYDGKTLSQLTYDPQTGKPMPSERQVRLEPKDFAASNFPRRIFLGREFLGTALPVSQSEVAEDPRRPGQKAIISRRPTMLVYEDDKKQAAQAPAQQMSIYWVDARTMTPVEYYERRDAAGKPELKPEALSTKFTAVAALPDGGAIPTAWTTTTWDVRGMAQVTNFNLQAAFNRRLDGSWFTKPEAAAPQEAPR